MKRPPLPSLLSICSTDCQRVIKSLPAENSVCDNGALRLKPISGSSSSSVSSSSSSAWRSWKHILPFPSKGKSRLKKSRDPNVYIRNIYIYAYIHQTHCNIIHPFHISHYIPIYPITSLPSALTGGGSVFTGSIFTAWAFEDLRVPKIWIFNGGFLTQKWSCQGLHPSCLLHEGLCKLVLWFGCWAALMDNFFVYAIATQ